MAFTDLGEIYTCRDGGITWKTYKDRIAFPEEEGVIDFSITTDDRYIWLKDKKENGKVWRGIYLEK